MDMKIFDLNTRLLMREQLSAEEIKLLRDYNSKYELVRFLVMEKNKSKNFHFTPGDLFMELPIIDIVNECLKVFDGKPFRFNDGKSLDPSNPPVTGQEKQKLFSPPVSIWENG